MSKMHSEFEDLVVWILELRVLPVPGLLCLRLQSNHGDWLGGTSLSPGAQTILLL